MTPHEYRVKALTDYCQSYQLTNDATTLSYCVMLSVDLGKCMSVYITVLDVCVVCVCVCACVRACVHPKTLYNMCIHVCTYTYIHYTVVLEKHCRRPDVTKIRHTKFSKIESASANKVEKELMMSKHDTYSSIPVDNHFYFVFHGLFLTHLSIFRLHIAHNLKTLILYCTD